MNHYNFSFYTAYTIALGQQSCYYEQHIEYCQQRGIPTSSWVRQYNHVKTAH